MESELNKINLADQEKEESEDTDVDGSKSEQKQF